MAFQRQPVASVAAPSFGAGNRMPSSTAPATREQRPPAQLWLNVGMTFQGAGPADEHGHATDLFVALPSGIALDDMKELPTNRGSDEYRELQTARNDLAQRVMDACSKLQPGEEMLLNLQVQVRRVKEDAAPIDRTKSRFNIADLSL